MAGQDLRSLVFEIPRARLSSIRWLRRLEQPVKPSGLTADPGRSGEKTVAELVETKEPHRFLGRSASSVRPGARLHQSYELPGPLGRYPGARHGVAGEVIILDPNRISCRRVHMVHMVYQSHHPLRNGPKRPKPLTYVLCYIGVHEMSGPVKKHSLEFNSHGGGWYGPERVIYTMFQIPNRSKQVVTLVTSGFPPPE